MKEELIKREGIKEVWHTFENVMDNNAKNTKELYSVLKKELDTNEHLSNDFREIIQKEIEAYEKALDKSTSEEERKLIYNKLEKLVEEAKKKYDDNMINNKELRENAIKIDEDNRKFNWGIAVNFGVGVLATIGVLSIGAKGYDVAKNYIEKNKF